MKIVGPAFTILALFFATGCDDKKADNKGASPAKTPAGANGDKDTEPAPANDDAQKQGTGDAELPAGVEEKPADELPKTDSADKTE